MKKTFRLNQKRFRFKRFERKKFSAYNSMHKVVSIGVLSIMTLSLTNTTKTSAQTTDSIKKDTISAQNIEEVEVKDKALTTPINQVARLVTVINQKDIERLKPKSVSELLSLISSVDVLSRGVHGMQSDISIRGGSFDQTAILLNGINITNPQTGHYSLDIPINISDIEKIEVLSGPSAIVYGSSAFSGGINIITKKGIDKGLNVKLEGGLHSLFASEISGAYKIKNMENYLSFGYGTCDGYINNTDYKTMNLLYQSRFNLKYNNKIDFQAGINKKSYGANSFYSALYPNQHDKTSSYLVSLKGSFFKTLKLLPSVYYNRHDDEFELIKGSGNKNYHQSNVVGGGLNFQYNSILGTTNFGVDTRYEEILSNVLGIAMATAHGNYTKEDNRTNVSYFLQQNYNYKRLNLALGVLSFYNSEIKQDFYLYPSINISFKIDNHFDIYSSCSSSSRLPTFTELYYNTQTHIANHNLKQEKSNAVEVGVKAKNRFLLASLSAYYMKGKDLIDWVKKNADDTKWQSMNITEVNKYGIDFTSKVFLKEVFSFLPTNALLELDYSYLTEDQVKNEYISSYVLNYLKHKITAKLYLPMFNERFSTTISMKYCKRMGEFISYASSTPTKTSYKPFAIVDVDFNYKVSKFDFYVNLNNIFNKEYYDIGNVPQNKFWLIGGIKFSL